MPFNRAEYMHKYFVDYYFKNKNYFYEKIMCECGFIYPRYNLSRHKKSKKHAQYLKLKIGLDGSSSSNYHL